MWLYLRNLIYYIINTLAFFIGIMVFTNEIWKYDFKKVLNKAQSKSFAYMSIYLSKKFLTDGHLYVTISRSKQQLALYVVPNFS